MKKVKKYVLFLLAGTILIACNKSNSGEPVTKLGPISENRTVLVYIIGENSLNTYVNTNIKGMIAGTAGQPDLPGNLIVYYDQYNENPTMLRISNGLVDTVKIYEEQNSASVGVMRQVIADAATLFPAQNYGLVLWSHGTGWKTVQSTESALLRASTGVYTSPSDHLLRIPEIYTGSEPNTKAFGQDRNSWMNISDIADALQDGYFEFLAFDACMMGAIEVLYDLRNKADYFIVSPAEVIANGFDYKTVTAPLLKGDAIGIAQKYFDYYNTLSGDYRSATITTVKASEIQPTVEVFKSILANNVSKINRTTMSGVQEYGYSSSVRRSAFDIDDFVNRIASVSEYTAFRQQMEKMVIYGATTPYFFESSSSKLVFSHYSGVSCYIPFASFPYDSAYFATNWYSEFYP